MLSCEEYLASGGTTEERDPRILNYYPSLDGETGKLTPKTMFLSDGKELSVEAFVDNKVVWTQPILIIKNKYSSTMLNAWDGEMCIDQENGTIMSTMVGAGKKDVNNTFTGVLMGDIVAGAGFDERNHKGIGIYGFHQGDQSFGFNVDGTAFIGKAGRGRISMDGNKGTIQSGSYEKFTAGMQIDLDGRDSLSASLRAYGPGGSFELDTDSSSPLFEIRSGPEADAGKLIHIGNQKNQDFYIQSWDYNKANKIGTRLDLETGIYETYSDANSSGESSYIRINPNGNNGYFVIHDKARVDDHIFYCSPTTFYLQSVNYVENTTGMKLDLRNGTIDARKGYIGGWEITSSSIKAGNIILSATGSMKGGEAGKEWYIEEDGTASFNNLTVTGTGRIGPFTVSATALTYYNTPKFTLDANGMSLNGAFTVDRDGNVYIGGNLKVAGEADLTGYMKTSEGGKFYNGGSGGGSYYSFGTNEANIGPWTINDKGISTTTGSFLGAEGNLILTNKKGDLTVGDDATQIKYGTNMLFEVNSQHAYAQFSDVNHSLTICSGYSQLRSGTAWVEAIDGKEVQCYYDGSHGFHADSTQARISAENASCQVGSSEVFLTTGTTSFKLTESNIEIDNLSCKKDQTINIRWMFSTSTKLKFHKGLLVTDGLPDSDNDATSVDLDVPLNVNGAISAYKPGTSTLTALGKLAFSDYVSKKVDVTLTGTVSVSYPGGGGGTVYVYEDSQGYYMGWGWSRSSVYTNHPITINGASGGTKSVKVKLSKDFMADFYPSEDDDTETFNFTADSATIV